MRHSQLRTSPLGSTGLEITRVGFGAWAIGGGGWEFGWGPQATTSRSPRSTGLGKCPGRTPGYVIGARLWEGHFKGRWLFCWLSWM
jgi:hypothetical protein